MSKFNFIIGDIAQILYICIIKAQLERQRVVKMRSSTPYTQAINIDKAVELVLKAVDEYLIRAESKISLFHGEKGKSRARKIANTLKHAGSQNDPLSQLAILLAIFGLCKKSFLLSLNESRLLINLIVEHWLPGKYVTYSKHPADNIDTLESSIFELPLLRKVKNDISHTICTWSSSGLSGSAEAQSSASIDKISAIRSLLFKAIDKEYKNNMKSIKRHAEKFYQFFEKYTLEEKCNYSLFMPSEKYNVNLAEGAIFGMLKRKNLYIPMGVSETIALFFSPKELASTKIVCKDAMNESKYAEREIQQEIDKVYRTL